MATCLDIVTNAMILRRILGIGKEPKAAEAALGMTALQSLYDQWRTGGMFGTLEDMYLEESETALEGKRYFVPTGLTLTDATSVYEDEQGNTRQPRDLAMYESLTEAGTHSVKLYDRKEWVDLLGLELADTAPLSGRNSLGLAACLATSGGFVAAFGGEVSQEVVALARHFLRSIMDKGGTTQADRTADYF
jgi:hypothetical protein